MNLNFKSSTLRLQLYVLQLYVVMIVSGTIGVVCPGNNAEVTMGE